ncbi:glycosyltransferase [Gallibacterium melopsittaci]|uniref:Glycosyltransferase n=1 Tax=Gallibacterium melopsittaci TaxID=516063 RepID=A0ABV6HSZ2_9PAST
MELEAIQMLWIGEKLSPIEQLSIRSFLANGHPVHLYVYEDVIGIPEGTTVLNANEIIPSNQIFKFLGSYAAFADLFRWKLLLDKGGYYSDMDVICIKPFRFQCDIIVGWEQNGTLLTPTIMKFPAKSPLVEIMYNSAKYPLKIFRHDNWKVILKKLYYFLTRKEMKAIGWGECAGPLALSRAYFYYQYNKKIIPLDSDVFYPIYWTKVKKFIEPDAISIDSLPKSTHAVHLWNEVWKREGMDKNKRYASNTLLGELFNKYYK